MHLKEALVFDKLRENMNTVTVRLTAFFFFFLYQSRTFQTTVSQTNSQRMNKIISQCQCDPVHWDLKEENNPTPVDKLMACASNAAL